VFKTLVIFVGLVNKKNTGTCAIGTGHFLGLSGISPFDAHTLQGTMPYPTKPPNGKAGTDSKVTFDSDMLVPRI